MLFSVGIETPKDDSFAYGIVVPALCIEQYRCYSAADAENDIAPMATEAILLIIESMQENGFAIEAIKDAGDMAYKAMADYTFCDKWLLVEVDVSAFDCSL